MRKKGDKNHEESNVFGFFDVCPFISLLQER
jgi:hypothetical protein